jgi:hypothetical protein
MYRTASQLHPEPGDKLFAEVDASWYQGRGAFGGIQAAWLIHAMEQLPETAGRTLRTLTVHCCAPVIAGRAEARAKPVRVGSAVTHAEARLLQGGVAAAALATFGLPRGQVLELPAAPAPAREELPPVPWSPLFPTFTQHVQFRFGVDCVPYSGQASAVMGGRARFAGGAPVTPAMLVALSDAWPPAVLPTFDRPRPVATVDWTTNLYPLPHGLPDDAWWRYESTASWADDGYVVQHARMWAPDGAPVLEGRQLLAVLG